jgi:P-type Ca2+ transporter type 2C
MTPMVADEERSPTVIVGLSDAEAKDRLARLGANEIPSERPPSIASRFTLQLRDPMALLLSAAAAVSWVLLHEVPEAIAIAAIVAANAAVTVIQESRAQGALEALKEFSQPRARVIRSGILKDVRASDLVIGDLVRVTAGERVPADLGLVVGEDLRVDESVLTGESRFVAKEVARDSVLLMGTFVARGSGTGEVIATGRDTAVGKIAVSLTTEKRRTPLQQELARLTAILGFAAIVAAAGAFAIMALAGAGDEGAVQRAFLTAVSLAVAAVPEGLATVVAVGLAVGVTRMAQRGAIVRRLVAVETLGTTTVLATDKTGTLTQNRLDVVDVWCPNGVAPERLTRVAGLCNDALTGQSSDDPLDLALLRWAGEPAVEDLCAGYRRIDALAFDSERRSMTVLVERSEGDRWVLVKGAPEVIVAASDHFGVEGRALSDTDADEVMAAAKSFAQRSLKVIALADKRAHSLDGGSGFILVGLLGLGDPVRPEAASAVADAQRAGVSLVMVTGDHPATASAVARDVGLAEDPVVTGSQIDDMGLPVDPLTTPIYARARPEHKLALVERLQERDHVVAVTGDGVNDAPALHRADIGVAMGASGTDVAREAADMVITDDDLGTIVHAIEQGRGIYTNTRKVVVYLVAANIAEVLVVVTALVVFPKLIVPLLPLQLLWINLVTDGLPAVGLALDPVAKTVMDHPPRPRSEHLVNRELAMGIGGRAVLMASACLAALFVTRSWGESWEMARTNAFMALALTQLAHASVVSALLTDTKIRNIRNPWLLVGILGGVAAQLVAVLWPPARELLSLVPMAASDWLLAIVAAVLPHWIAWFVRHARVGRRPTR